MIEVRGVSKSYGKKEKRKVILDKISFEVKDGEMLALLGHNGSGKSTLLKCVCGVLYPDEGEVLINKKNSFKHRKKLVQEMGVFFNGKPSFITDLSVSDNLEYFKAAYSLENEEFKKRKKLLCEYINIENLLDKPYRKLSLGERVKCELFSVLFYNPGTIILDEPTAGLDYTSKRGLYDYLSYVKKRYNVCSIIVTHDVQEIESVCDRAVILNEGRIEFFGTPEDICNELLNTKILSIKFDCVTDKTKADKILALSENYNNQEKSFCITVDAADKDKQLKSVTDAFSVTSIEVLGISLKEAFEHVLQKNNKANRSSF